MDCVSVTKVLKPHLTQRALDIWSIDSAFMSDMEYRKALRLNLPLIYWKKAWLTEEEKLERKALRALCVKQNRNKALKDRVVVDTLPCVGKVLTESTCKYCKGVMTADYLCSKVERFCLKCYAIRLPKISQVSGTDYQTRRATAATCVPADNFSRLKNFKSYLQKIQGRLGLSITNNELQKVREHLGGDAPEYDLLRKILHILGYRNLYGSVHSLQKLLGYPLPDYSDSEMEKIVQKFIEMGFETKDRGLLHADILDLVLENL